MPTRLPLVVILLFLTAGSLWAQTVVATARSIRTSVILGDPRGDAAVVR
jgi:hypothetical protein